MSKRQIRVGDWMFPHWDPKHRGEYTRKWWADADSNPIHRNEAGLWHRWNPKLFKLICVSEQPPYLEDIPPSVERLIIRYHPLSENFEQRQFLDEADAKRQAQRDSEICERIAQNCEARGWPRSKLVFALRNEPQVWAGEPYHLLTVYTVEALRCNHARNINSMIGEWGSGWPPDLGQRDTPHNWLPFKPAVDAMGPGDLIGMHPYYGMNGPLENYLWWAGSWLMRPGWMFGKKIVFSEWGSDWGVHGSEYAKRGWLDYPGELGAKASRYVQEHEQLMLLCLLDPDIIGAGPFTADGNRDDWAHFETLIDAYMDRFIPFADRTLEVDTWADTRTYPYIARWKWLIDQNADRFALDSRVVATIMALESGGNPWAESDLRPRYPVGAIGLMQVMPKETGFADRPARANLFTPTINVEWGCRILSGNLKAAKGDLAWALCYYYGAKGGPTSTAGKHYLDTFRRVWGELWPRRDCPIDGTAHADMPEPIGEDLRQLLLNGARANQLIQFNPAAALQKRIFADGYVPNSPEFDVSLNGVSYRGQRAEHLGSGAVRVYFARVGDWGNVKSVS